MDISGILSEYEETQQKSRDAAEKKRLDEISRRGLNAGLVQQHLREVIEPVLQSVRGQLEGKGYPAKVEIVLPASGGTAYALAMRLHAQKFKGKLEAASTISFVGDDDDLTMIIVVVMARQPQDVPIEEKPRPLASVTSEVVEEKVERFLRAVFS